MALTDPVISSTVSPLHTKAHEVCGDLGFGRGTIHDLKHDVIGFFFREVDAVNQFCEGGL